MTEAEEVVTLLTAEKASLATAESCTGGLLAASIVQVSGASACYYGGFVTYANEAKEEQIQVSHDTLLKFGAVSRETAGEMVCGTLKQTGASYAVATTGIAGPTGGTKDKPVGLVYIGCGNKEKVCVEKHIFSGDREEIRRAAVTRGLQMLLHMVKNKE